MSVADTIARLAAIGGTGDGGVDRPAWSEALFEAYRLLADELRGLGLAVETDAAGNLLARWDAGDGPAVLVGSHLDTVPHGGRLDGSLGVVAGLHAIRQLREEGFEPARPLWLVAFMDEEGWRFDAAFYGSRAFVGEDVSTLADRADADGIRLADAAAAAGRPVAQAVEARRIEDVGAYLELHIEQGPVLEEAGVPLGVVTGIVGLLGYRVRLTGQANHAGTTPMRLRRDALVGAARLAVALRDAARGRDGATANVGTLRVEPGGSNVVPGLAELSVDVRAASPDGLAEWERTVPALVERIAAEEGLIAEVEQTFRVEPLALDPALVDLVEASATAVGAPSLRLPSGAGHDATVVGRHVPAAMLFVPSRGGVSHSPDEHTDAEALERGTQVLTEALRRLLTAPAR